VSTKQKTGVEVFNRIRWDTSYDKEHILVGLEEKTGTITEQKFSEMAGKQTVTSETLSKIRYLKHKDAILWDPRANIDKIFKQ
jgi:hypothetical protein